MLLKIPGGQWSPIRGAVLVCAQIPKRQLVWAQNYHFFGNSRVVIIQMVCTQLPFRL